MKIIPKHLRGGSFDAFFTTYVPVGGSAQESGSSSGTSRGSRSSSSDSTKGLLTEKDFYDMIKDIDGLPNEMSSVISNLVDLTKLLNLTGIDVGDLSTSYLLNLLLLKVIELNKEKYDEVMKQASENGSLVEPAIATNGDLLFLKDDGSIGTVDIETFNKNRDRYKDRLLTVSNLAYMRKFDPKLAYNLSIFDIIDNSMGYEEFLKLLSDAAQSLGTSESSREGLFSVLNLALQGYKVLQSLSLNDQVLAMDSISLEGLYNYKLIDSNLQLQIRNLLSYIVSAFPDRAKTWASIKTGISDKNKALGLLSLAYLLGKQTTKHLFGIDYLGGIDKLQGSSKSKSNVDDIPLDIATKWLRGLGVLDTFVINPGTDYSISVISNTLPLTDLNKKYLGANSLLLLATQGDYAGILDFNNVSMGMRKINASNFNKIVLTDGKISSVDFPYTTLADGTIVPDLSENTFKAKLKADLEIRRLGIDLSNRDLIINNYLKINNIYAKYGLPQAYNSDGSTAEKWTRFGVINASASNSSLGMDLFDTNNLLLEITDDSIIDNLLSITKEENYDRNNFLWNGTDHFYLGNIWIPIKVSYIAAAANKSMDTGLVNTIINLENQLNASKILTKEKK